MATLSLIWRAAGLLLAIEARAVTEVLPPVACRAAPGVPGWIRGLFVHRGSLIPLVDANRLLCETAGHQTAVPPDRMSNRVLVLDVPDGAHGAAWRAGLWVESLLDLERIAFGGDGTHPGFATDGARFLGPVARTRLGFVQLVRPVELFTPDQVEILTGRLEEGAA